MGGQDKDTSVCEAGTAGATKANQGVHSLLLSWQSSPGKQGPSHIMVIWEDEQIHPEHSSCFLPFISFFFWIITGYRTSFWLLWVSSPGRVSSQTLTHPHLCWQGSIRSSKGLECGQIPVSNHWNLMHYWWFFTTNPKCSNICAAVGTVNSVPLEASTDKLYLTMGNLLWYSRESICKPQVMWRSENLFAPVPCCAITGGRWIEFTRSHLKHKQYMVKLLSSCWKMCTKCWEIIWRSFAFFFFFFFIYASICFWVLLELGN